MINKKNSDDVREKLVDLIHKAKLSMWGKNGLPNEKAQNSYIADYLISPGVTVQELDGCEFCNAEYAEWSECVSHDFRIKGNALYYYDDTYGWDGIVIYHCPMCGRKLPQPPKGE